MGGKEIRVKERSKEESRRDRRKEEQG
jgi:hypothetical protein